MSESFTNPNIDNRYKDRISFSLYICVKYSVLSLTAFWYKISQYYFFYRIGATLWNVSQLYPLSYKMSIDSFYSNLLMTGHSKCDSRWWSEYNILMAYDTLSCHNVMVPLKVNFVCVKLLGSLYWAVSANVQFVRYIFLVSKLWCQWYCGILWHYSMYGYRIMCLFKFICCSANSNDWTQKALYIQRVYLI